MGKDINEDIKLLKSYLKSMKDVPIGGNVIILLAIENLLKEYENLTNKNKKLEQKITYLKEHNYKGNLGDVDFIKGVIYER